MFYNDFQPLSYCQDGLTFRSLLIFSIDYGKALGGPRILIERCPAEFEVRVYDRESFSGLFEAQYTRDAPLTPIHYEMVYAWRWMF